MSRKFTFTTQVYDERTDFPATGDVDVIYIDASKNTAYRYDVDYYTISSAEVDIWGAIGSLSKGGGGGGGASWGSITGTLSSQTDLQTALDAKQDDLVSGTNIKTINSTSVLGSGNIAVQPTLVSGTNIRTINGNSVLGSGNLTISGGGGIGGLQAFLPVSGNVIPASTYGGLFGSAMIPDRVLIYPFIPSQNFTTSALRINVTAAVAGANARILIYNNVAGTYRPNTKILETTNLDCSTPGEKSFLYSATFTKGEVYWIAVYSNSNPSVTHISAGNLFTLRQEQGNAMQEIEATYTFGTAPATFPSVVGYNNRNCPNVGFVIA